MKDASVFRLLGVSWWLFSQAYGKESACNAGDLSAIPGSGRSLGEGNGNPLQYFSLENPMDSGAWWAIVHGVELDMTEQLHFCFPKKYVGILASVNVNVFRNSVFADVSKLR